MHKIKNKKELTVSGAYLRVREQDGMFWLVMRNFPCAEHWKENPRPAQSHKFSGVKKWKKAHVSSKV
jgi:hypothetical protein